MVDKKILVTGAAGFIGFHLSNTLLKKGYKIVGLDNLNDYYSQQLKYDRLKELGINNIVESEIIYESDSGQFRFLKGDLENTSLWENHIKSEGITHIIHLAAQAGVRYSLENPRAYISSNISGFLNVLEFCREQKINHLIYASSSSVYGMNSAQPFCENEKCDQPVSLYAATKRANEIMAFTYHHLYDLNSMGLRFFTVYGPWGRPDMAPILFAKAAYERNPIKVFNHGNQSRDFTYIDDIINGIIAVFEKKEEVVKGAEICNIGNGSPVYLMDFIHAIEKETGIELKKEFMDAQMGDVAITFADTTRLLDKVNYTPVVNISEGVKKFIDWYKGYEKIK
jgi:UDP-glucuronate 4-epimerase